MIPYNEIRKNLGEPLRDGQITVAARLYCAKLDTKMADVNLTDFMDWMKRGLVKLRAGCSGKVGYDSRKAAKQKLKKRERIESDGVYQCPHCERWHITSKLLEPQEPAYSYRLYGQRLD